MILPVSQAYLVAGIFALFAILGFRRGWGREGITAAGIALGWLVATGVGTALLDALNDLVVMAVFTLRGGFEAPNAEQILEDLRLAPLIDPAQPQVFLAALFVVVVAASYLLANRLIPEPIDVLPRGAGALLGGFNGCLLAYVLLGYFPPDEDVTLSVSLSGPRALDFLQGNLNVLLAVVLALGGGFLIYNLKRGRGSARRRGGRWMGQPPTGR